MQEITNKIAVVTGGGSGIGLGIAVALAAEGAHIAIADVDFDSARKAAERLRGMGVRSIAIETDVTQSDSVDDLAAAVLAEFGGVDLLINNAGVYLGGPMRDVTEDDWRFVLDVNLDGAFRVGQTFAAILREQDRGGHIVNTASIGGFIIHPEGLSYGVSKFGVVAYSEALRADLEADGIGVSTLCPGPIATNLPKSDRLRRGSDRVGGSSQALDIFVRSGMAPEEVGPIVVRGIRANAPYIFTHDFSEIFSQRFDAILSGFDLLREASNEAE
jgi:NAD(P)-dependent dehydrogenase (short-subunit alcohol dehydrogenase family)